MQIIITGTYYPMENRLMVYQMDMVVVVHKAVALVLDKQVLWL